MPYFDTDVLIHYLVTQEPAKHQQARQLYEEAVSRQAFFISLLSLQELTYALAKLQIPNGDLEDAVRNWHSVDVINYTANDLDRAIYLARQVGFRHINDCLHTAIAESQNCPELVTYNRKDFARIQPLTHLKITIL